LPSINLTRDGVIATVAINNPAKLNALTVAMWRELARVMRELSADDDLRCVVLRGAGDDAFAAGADIAEFATVRNNFALIKGACAGGGLELSCCCDLRIAGESARLGVPINRLGFALAYGELAGLIAVAGRAVAAEILIEGRMWRADEAFAKGLLTRVVADDQVVDEAYATARRIADGAPLVARWHKQFIRRLTPQAAPLSDAEIDANFDYFKTEDYRIGYDAFINKTKPAFKGR
jgi:enoyl-CoA hydratase/carnithine racemase